MIDQLNVGIAILTLVIGCFTFVKWKYQYWRNRQVPYIEPHFPFGTNGNPFNRKVNNAMLLQEQYEYFKSLKYKYGGLYIFFSPALLAVDTEFIKNVMLKDFQYFTDRGLYHNEKDDPLSAHLFTIGGPKWRELRTKLTPTFTSGKIKNMFPTLVVCGNPLYAAVTKLYEKNEPVDIRDISGRFTTDVIGSCAFGLECNSFIEPESDFRKYGKMFLAAPSKFEVIKFVIYATSHEVARRLRLTPPGNLSKKFFLNIVKETVNYRKQNNIKRNDFMQLVMNLMDVDCNGKGLTIEQVAAQAFVFFIAGFETSSTTMTFCLCELAVNQEIQKKVREEINSILAKHNENITYEAIMEMKYLHTVIEETLRKYPPIPVLLRMCVRDYEIPGTETIIKKGTRVILPLFGLHHDPEHFPDPEKFDPDRFSDENREKVTLFSNMPFGEGPRNCIGLRFGLLQAKVGLVLLLRSLNFRLNAKTKFPLEYDPTNFILSSNGGVWLDIDKISNGSE